MRLKDEDGYWDTADLEEVDKCPICHARANGGVLYPSVPDLLEHIPGSWSIARCGACRSLFLKVRPRRTSIDKAYRSYYTHQLSAESSSQGTNWIWRAINDYLHARYGYSRTPRMPLGASLVRIVPMIRQQLDYFLRMLPKRRGRLLDIGCGNGVFLARALKCGWEVHGIEPDPQAARMAEKISKNVHQIAFESFATPLRFDAITASHVIEHVYEPLSFAKHALSLLNPGGTFWISTPNAGSIGHWWFKAAWRGLEPPRHLSIFSAGALVRTLQRAGFESVTLHRRGRGSKYILAESHKNSIALDSRDRRSMSPLVVDLAASIFPALAEELIVTAVRPK